MPIVPGSALRITPAWIAALAAAAVGMTLGYPVACIIFEHELAHRVPAAFVGLTTGLLAMLVVLGAAGRAAPAPPSAPRAGASSQVVSTPA
jgi:hypothetical protein